MTERMTLEPTVSKIGIYGMSETARILDIHRNTLRNYIQRHLIKTEVSKLNGRNVVRGKEIIRFWRWRLTTEKL